jgi:hypothetical protein
LPIRQMASQTTMLGVVKDSDCRIAREALVTTEGLVPE